MITGIWKGWTRPQTADAYEALLRETIFPGILDKGIGGLICIELFRRDAGTETAFMTLFRFADLDSVKAMAGEDGDAAYVPDAARQVLSRFDARARHFETRASLRTERVST